MIPFLPKKISYKAIAIYFASLAVISVVFIRYAMRISFILLGATEVLGFFLLARYCSKRWAKVSSTTFIQNVVLMALTLRVIWVFFSYFFYTNLTGQPFEPGAADSMGYHGEASWLKTETWNTVWDYYFRRGGVSDSGYGFYLTLFYKIFGAGVILPRLFKAVYSTITCVLIYKLTSRSINEATGRLAALFAVFMPNLIIYCGLHLKETEMLFLLTAFLERADYLIRSRRYNFWTIAVPLLIAGSLFFFRTVLGAIAILSFCAGMLITSTRVVGRAKRWASVGLLAVSAVVLAGGTIATEIEGYFEERTENQSARRQQQTSRGNQWAQYATGTVMAPMMFVMPFSTMVDVDQQYSQQIIHGGNYVRNFMGFFVLLAVFLALFVTKDWRNLTLVGSYVVGYLIVLASSGFANSERFLLPALPGLIIMWAYGLTHLNAKSFRWFNLWLVVVFMMEVGWAYFKLGSRGLF